jgi:hypothetical protein
MAYKRRSSSSSSWDFDAADRSAEEAEKDLREMVAKMSAQERKGAQELVDWARRWIAGHEENHRVSRNAIANIMRDVL